MPRPKRGQNEGTCYQRADGRWEAATSIGTVDGKPKRLRRYGKTAKEARASLKAARDDLEQGHSTAVDRQTVAVFLDRWLADVVKPSVRPSTHTSYALHVRLYLKPAIGHHQLARLAPQHVQALMNEKSASGLSPRTVQYMRAVLRRALGQALKWGLVKRNVATLVDPPRSKRPTVRPLSPQQVATFLDAAGGHRLEALFAAAIATGLRQGELLGLRWQDVDLDAGILHVRHAMQRVDGALTLVEPKTERSRRTLSLPVPTVAALRAHQDRQAFERAAAGDRWQGQDLVFATPHGTPLDGTAVTKRLQAILDAAGLPHQRFHDLRHCCASLLLAENVSPRVVMEILGHSQIGLTMNTYSHVMPAAQRDAADRMGRVLGATVSGSTE